MFNSFQNIIAWEFWEKRQLPYVVPERKGCKAQAHSPVAASLLVWPRLCLWRCSSEHLGSARIFPASGSTLSIGLKNVTAVEPCFILFVSQGFLLNFCSVSCILRCVAGTVSTVDIPEWNPHYRSTPGMESTSQVQEISNLWILLKMYHIQTLLQELLLHVEQVMLQVSKTANWMLVPEFNSISYRRWQEHWKEQKEGTDVKCMREN